MLDGSFYKDDALLPVYSNTPETFDLEDVVRTLLLNYSPDCLCFSQPVNLAHNVSFLVDTSNLKHQDNIVLNVTTQQVLGNVIAPKKISMSFHR